MKENMADEIEDAIESAHRNYRKFTKLVQQDEKGDDNVWFLK